MDIENEIHSAVKSERAVLGYRESMKLIKTGSAEKVIVASNIPKDMDAEIRHNAKSGELQVETFDGSSKDLGTACGKPFPVAVMAIKR